MGGVLKDIKSLLEFTPLFLHPHGTHEESILQLQSKEVLGFDICIRINGLKLNSPQQQ